MFIETSFIIAKIWKQPIDEQPSTDEMIKKMWYIHTVEYCTGFQKKKEILPFVKIPMDLEDTMLSEISQTQKDKY